MRRSASRVTTLGGALSLAIASLVVSQDSLSQFPAPPGGSLPSPAVTQRPDRSRKTPSDAPPIELPGHFNEFKKKFDEQLRRTRPWGVPTVGKVKILTNDWSQKREPTGGIAGSPAGKERQPLPAWGGGGGVVKACDEAIEGLRNADVSDKPTAGVTISRRKAEAEVRFESHCLSNSYAAALDSIVGRLEFDGATVCTATLVTRRLALTALHCVYILPKADTVMIANPRRELRGKVTIEFGAPAKAVERRVKALHVFGDRGQRSWTRLALNDVFTANDGHLRIGLGNDYVFLELEQEVDATPAESLGGLVLEKDERFVIYGYYYMSELGQQADDSGMRSSRAGFCQNLEEDKLCVAHGCPTTTGYSGAPLFVERRNKLYLAAIHVDSHGELTGCDTRQWDRTVNVGLRVPWKF